MKLKKIIAAVAATAVAVSTLALSAFAATVTLDSEYTGDWSSSTPISKADLQAIGGDVKVVLEIETYDPFGLADQFLIAPMDYDNSWTRVTDQLTSDTVVAKTDGFIGINKNATSVEFVIPAATIDSLGDSGLAFQVQKVTIKSAELTAGTPEAAISALAEDEVKAYCFADDISGYGANAGAADTTADAPAADTTADTAAETTETTSTATGNTSAAVILSVMAVAGVAAIAAKKRK